MSKARKRHTRKTRRQWKAALKFQGAKPKHESPKGRTGSAHAKSRSKVPRRVLRRLETLALGPDWTLRA